MRLLAIAIVACLMASTADSGPTTNPSTRYEFKVVAASNDGELAIKKFQVASGVKVSLFAAEPMLANPVAISADEKGRFFVAETFRINEGIIDINAGFYDWAHWLDEDLACRSVGDRLAEIKRHRSKEEAVRMGVASERISMVEDRSGTGVADHSTVFADGFSGIVNGIGAGILARYGKVWYADLPDLWQLTEGPDGTAVSRRSLHYGFGVRVGFEGHDLHGLKMGLDGRIYFTMADRGASIHVGGKVLNSLDCGCVFRCNPDGSDLEIFATGLRNPQSLAFDQYGNLFTGDNNADHGDAARWVYVVEGGDSGWRIGYQFMKNPDLGPWNTERLWALPYEGQAAYLVPPVAHIGSGPAGTCFYPGTGLPEHYKDHFSFATSTARHPAACIRLRSNPKERASK